MEDREDLDRPLAEGVHLRRAPDPRDPGLIAGDQLRREVAERGDHLRLDQFDLPEQVGAAGLDLDRLRIAVAGRPAFQDVRDEDVLPAQADALEQLVEQPARTTDERQPLLVLLRARRLADEHQVGVGVTRSEDDVRPALREWAEGAVGRLPVDLDQALPAGFGGLAQVGFLPFARRLSRPLWNRCRAPSRFVPRRSSIRRCWFGVGWRVSPKLESRRSAPGAPQAAQVSVSVPIATRDSKRSPHSPHSNS